MKIEIDLDQLKNDIAQEVVARLKPLLKPQGYDEDKIFTVETLAQYIHTEKSWIYRNIRQIPYFKVGRFPRFRKKDIDRWLEQHRPPLFE